MQEDNSSLTPVEVAQWTGRGDGWDEGRSEMVSVLPRSGRGSPERGWFALRCFQAGVTAVQGLQIREGSSSADSGHVRRSAERVLFQGVSSPGRLCEAGIGLQGRQ